MHADTAAPTLALDWSTVGPWFRPETGAKLTGLTTRTLRSWVAKGYILTSRPAGGAVLISRDSLRAFVERGVRAHAA